jgi:hypothetical protein
MLINQLNWRPLAIVSNTVPDQHIEFVLVVLDGQHHGHSLSDLYDARNFRSPWTLAYLNLHPALKVVSEEVGRHGVKHINLEWSEGDGFFVEIVPRASQFARLKILEK